MGKRKDVYSVHLTSSWVRYHRKKYGHNFVNPTLAAWERKRRRKCLLIAVALLAAGTVLVVLHHHDVGIMPILGGVISLTVAFRPVSDDSPFVQDMEDIRRCLGCWIDRGSYIKVRRAANDMLIECAVDVERAKRGNVSLFYRSLNNQRLENKMALFERFGLFDPSPQMRDFWEGEARDRVDREGKGLKSRDQTTFV